MSGKRPSKALPSIRRRPWRVSLIVLLTLLCAACGGAGNDAESAAAIHGDAPASAGATAPEHSAL